MKKLVKLLSRKFKKGSNQKTTLAKFGILPKFIGLTYTKEI